MKIGYQVLYIKALRFSIILNKDIQDCLSLLVSLGFDLYDWVISFSKMAMAYLSFSNYDIISKFLLHKIVERNTDTIDDFTSE